VLADVRSIISEQLGTELDKVRPRGPQPRALRRGTDGRPAAAAAAGAPGRARARSRPAAQPCPPPPRRPHAAPPHLPPPRQVAPSAKFVDLGADSLDTVSGPCARPPAPQPVPRPAPRSPVFGKALRPNRPALSPCGPPPAPTSFSTLTYPNPQPLLSPFQPPRSRS
jgi:hypothetical protein